MGTETEDPKTISKAKEAEAKKQKMTGVPVAPDEEWPEAWFMTETVEDQCKPCRQEPNKPVSAADMRKLGISYWKMDADSYKYPIKVVPWDPKDATDPKLQALRDDRGYSYADIITGTFRYDRLHKVLLCYKKFQHANSFISVPF